MNMEKGTLEALLGVGGKTAAVGLVGYFIILAFLEAQAVQALVFLILIGYFALLLRTNPKDEGNGAFKVARTTSVFTAPAVAMAAILAAPPPSGDVAASPPSFSATVLHYDTQDPDGLSRLAREANRGISPAFDEQRIRLEQAGLELESADARKMAEQLLADWPHLDEQRRKSLVPAMWPHLDEQGRMELLEMISHDAKPDGIMEIKPGD